MNEEIFRRDIAYRPPDERNSILLEAGWGCSWSKCTFCKENKNKAFHIEGRNEIIKKIKLISKEAEGKKRLFILGEDALIMGFPKLKELFSDISMYLPEVDYISMYGRAEQVLRLSCEELEVLKEMNLRLLYIGIESGSDEVLQRCQKGETSLVMKKALWRLDSAGIKYSLSIILGLGGKELAAEHVKKTAELLNSVHPSSIRVSALKPIEGTELQRQIDKGEFVMLSQKGILIEERLLLEYLSIDDCDFFANNFSNFMPLSGRLERDKEVLCGELDKIINSFSEI